MISSTTDLKILSGSANPALAESIAQKLGVELVPLALERFPDSELHVEVQQSVRGHDVYVVNSSCSPVDEHIVELLFIADACARAGASRLTAVIPYCGYARQDRRAHGREAVGGRVMANLICAGGLQHVVAVDLHSAAMEAMFSIPLEHLTAVPILAEAVRPWIGAKTVVVAPDLGAVKLAERYGRTFHLPVVIVHKTRLSGSEVAVQSIIGEVKGRAILIVDDMISTGGTVEAAIKALLAAGCAADFMAVASHGLFAGPAVERFQKLPVRRVFVTDSVPAPSTAALPLETVSLAVLLAQAIDHLHHGRSLADLISHG
jgi:ribose-phosphate pyrophosphokinase